MITLLSISPQTLEAGLLVLARVSGLMLIAPVLSSRSVPRQPRVVLVAVLTLLLLPQAELGAESRAPLELGLGGLVPELVLGFAMGFVAQLFFASIDLASQVVSFGTGMSYINAVDPNSPVRATSIASFQFLVATMFFLAIDGHHLLLRALHTSFAVVPTGSVSTVGLASAVISSSGSLFALGLALSAPTLVTLMLVDLALGLAGRVAPQLQSLLIGMGLKPLAGFFSMSLVYGALPQAMSGAIDASILNVGRVIQAAAG